MDEPRGLLIQRRLGQTITINDIINITVMEIKGKHVRVCVECPDEFQVNRSEKYSDAIEMITAEKDASKPSPLRAHASKKTHPRYVKFRYGRYGGFSMDRIPSYFLKYVISKELEMESRSLNDQIHLDLLLEEQERRKNQSMKGNVGDSSNTIH